MIDGRPIVLLDCDGVLADFAKATCLAANKVFGIDIDPSTITEESIVKTVAKKVVEDMCTKSNAIVIHKEPDEYKIYSDAIYNELQKPGATKNFPVIPGTQDAVKELREIANVVIVTSPPAHGDTWMKERKEWLIEHYQFEVDDIMFCRRKQMVKGDIFVDDYHVNINAWAKYNIGEAYLWDTHYNKQAQTKLRENSWHKIIQRTKSLR